MPSDLIAEGIHYTHTYSIARFKLDACEHILASANTFSSNSQLMLASKGSMLSSKGNMLSYMILLAIELDASAQLLACIIVQSVDAPEQDYMLSCMIYSRFKLDACVHYSSSIQ